MYSKCNNRDSYWDYWLFFMNVFFRSLFGGFMGVIVWSIIAHANDI